MTITHATPRFGTSTMPCCGRTPYEVAIDDRMTSDARLVTCRPTAPAVPAGVETFIAIRRTDGEAIYSELGWVDAGREEAPSWEPAEVDSEDTDEGPVGYELVRMWVEPLERRQYEAGKQVPSDGG